MRRKWNGTPPQECNICNGPISKVFYDASVPAFGGSWGIVCPRCSRLHGIRLGTGLGQKYSLDEVSGDFVKIKG